jgi:hypothetical protein
MLFFTPGSRTNVRPWRLLFLGLAAATLHGCGGGGGGGAAADGGSLNVASLSGTYALRAGSSTIGSFMLDQAATITSCAVGQSQACEARVTSTGNGASFTLTGDAGGASASGTIGAGGAITGQITQGNGSVTPLTGSKVSDGYVDCAAPFTRSNGQCLPPESAKLVIAPVIVWVTTPMLSPNGFETWTLYLCWDPSHAPAGCDQISPVIKLDAEDLADNQTPPLKAYAFSVAKEFQNMIARLWAVKTYPTGKQMSSIFNNAIAADVASGGATQKAVQAAGTAFAAAGFPAAAGGQASSPSGTAPTAASACGALNYPGDTSEPQVYLHDKYAQFLGCLYKTTGDSQQLDNGNKVCTLLDGLLKSTTGTFTPLFCTGSKLKV